MAFLVRPSGEVSEGLGAFLPLTPRLPCGRALLWMLRWRFVRALAERAYHWVAAHRYQIFGAVESRERQS